MNKIKLQTIYYYMAITGLSLMAIGINKLYILISMM